MYVIENVCSVGACVGLICDGDIEGSTNVIDSSSSFLVHRKDVISQNILSQQRVFNLHLWPSSTQFVVGTSQVKLEVLHVNPSQQRR